MIRRTTIALLAFSICIHAGAQKPAEARRVYTLGVTEMTEAQRNDFNALFSDRMEKYEASRGAFSDAVFAANRTAFAKKVYTTGLEIANLAVEEVAEGLRKPRERWEQAVGKECRFSRNLGMVSEICDFYSSTSSRGALDASGMVFDGFSCRQDVRTEKGTINVFYVSCRLDTTRIDRIISHSKFEVYVDSVRFNPYLCDIPNDSLQDVTKRIPFSFESRSDLCLTLHVNIYSSWINEAVQVYTDQKLGSFDINISIDPSKVSEDPLHPGEFVYTYSSHDGPCRGVSVTGESFVVPRSYAGNDKTGSRMWGTGQYKIDMSISESCRINREYYVRTEPGGKEEWNDNWKAEWELISSRPASKSFWRQAGDIIRTDWAGNGWFTEITSPTTTYLIESGSTYLNGGTPVMQTTGMSGSTMGSASGSSMGMMSTAGAAGGQNNAGTMTGTVPAL